MVGKMEVEGFVGHYSPFRLLCALVVAPTKEERVFHSAWAELSDGCHDARSGRTIL